MKQAIHKLSFLVLTLFTAVSLSGCDEDSWYLATSELCGDWRIVEVTGSYDCNYQPGDYWTFYHNGDFRAQGRDGFYETGYWEQHGRELYFYFEGNNPEMVGYIRSFDDYYMIVDVKDYYYNSRYTLRLTRMSHFYSAGKEQNEP